MRGWGKPVQKYLSPWLCWHQFPTVKIRIRSLWNCSENLPSVKNYTSANSLFLWLDQSLVCCISKMGIKIKLFKICTNFSISSFENHYYLCKIASILNANKLNKSKPILRYYKLVHMQKIFGAYTVTNSFFSIDVFSSVFESGNQFFCWSNQKSVLLS